MSNSLHDFSRAFNQASVPSIRVVIIYENGASALRAKTMLDRLAGTFRDQFVFDVESWSFDMLRHSCVKNMVMQDSSEADLVVVSIEEDVRIPSEVVYGMAIWHPLAAEHPSAVTLLCHHEGKESVSLPLEYASLRSLTERSGMHFYCGDAERAMESIDTEIKNFGTRAIRPLHAMAYGGGRSMDEVGWGIND
jgi:hypothetical protein